MKIVTEGGGELDVDPRSYTLYSRVENLASAIGVERDRLYSLEIGFTANNSVYIQVLCERPDTYTGEYGTGRGGIRIINPGQSDSSIVRTIFAAFLAYEEHEVREAFTYKGKRIFGPHLDIDALVEVADRIEQQPSG